MKPRRFPATFEMMLFDRRRHVYRILFTIDGNTVNVLRIRHAAQDAIMQEDL